MKITLHRTKQGFALNFVTKRHIFAIGVDDLGQFKAKLY